MSFAKKRRYSRGKTSRPFSHKLWKEEAPTRLRGQSMLVLRVGPVSTMCLPTEQNISSESTGRPQRQAFSDSGEQDGRIDASTLN
jgi:hypothetical protein